MYVKVVEKSGDRKLTAKGNVSATWVAQQSCPTTCPLLHAGCYAESGLSAIHTKKLNRDGKRLRGGVRTFLARLEAKGIRALSGLRKLRVHVVGDCSIPQAAGIVGEAMVEHERKHGKMAWTYTHAWRDVPRRAWKGARVLASCNSVKEIKAAWKRGYGCSVITPRHPTNKVYELDGMKIIPCPAQFLKEGKRVVTCEHCNLCMEGDKLRARKLSVGFQPDYGTEARILTMLRATT